MKSKSEKLMSTMALLLAVFIIPFANANNDPGKIDTRDIPMQTPFLGVNATIPGIIECENYDEGGQGVAFFDKNLKLGLETFRPDDIVDVINKTQASNGLTVFKTRKDEWLEYTVDVTAGTYDITLSYFTNNSNTGALDVSLDGQAVASITGMVAQGSWNTQGTITMANVDIEQGGTDRILRLFFPNGPQFQIDAIEFDLVGDNDPCAGGPAVGTSCNDNDNCTVNDVILANCECAGTFQDSDNDGICDADEEPNPLLPVARINCGGDESTFQGNVFSEDFGFSNNQTARNFSIPLGPIYQTYRRNGDFSYDLPVPEDGEYTVILHFAESWFGATNGGPSSPNNQGLPRRTFDVEIEGNLVLNDYDITSEAGGPEIAITETFDINVTDGVLSIDFSNEINQAIVSAIEVLSRDVTPMGCDVGSSCNDNDNCTVNDVITADCECAGTFQDSDNDGICDADEGPNPLLPVARINSGGDQSTFEGNVFSKDFGFSNNQTASNTSIPLDPIYQTYRRNGDFSYDLEVPEDGEYTVILHFVEAWFGATNGGPSSPNNQGEPIRTFDVKLEGDLVLNDYDITSEAGGPEIAITETFETNVTDGVLSIEFSNVRNQAIVSAIEVLSRDVVINTPLDCNWRTNLASSNHTHIEAQSASIDGVLYLFGGLQRVGDNPDPSQNPLIFQNNTEIFDPIANTFTDGAPFRSGKEVNHGGMQAVGTDIWIVGGFAGLEAGGNGTDIVQIYDTLTDTWRDGPSLPIPMGSPAVVLLDGRVHAYGGYGEDRVTSLDDHFWINANQVNNVNAEWTRGPSIAVARGHHSGAAVDGKIYVIGGQIGHNTSNMGNIDDVQSYTFGDDAWVTVASLPKIRSHFEPATLAHNGKIIIAGGNQSEDSVLEYDPQTDEWSEICTLPDPLLTTNMFVSGERLIMQGGALARNPFPTKETIWIPIAPAENNRSSVQTSNDLKPQVNELTISMFPNPATNVVNLKLMDNKEAVKVVLKTFAGETVSSNNFDATEDITFEINQKAGIYFVQIITESGTAYVERLLVR